MQPKCSQSNTNNSSILQSSSSTISASAQQFLLVPVERFKEICLRSAAAAAATSNSAISNEINSVLDYFFEPEKDIYKFLSDFDLFKLYLTGGIGFDSFKNKVCGLVWNVNYVAYRCRTCALSPCMSICAECFRNGDHKGHDFNMFRSGAGGACDCGDECVMNSKGFCKSHGCHSSKSSQSALNPPDELTACCEQLLPNLLYRLIQYFRNVYSSTDFNLVSRSQTNLMLNDIQIYLEFLNELCSSGTPIRKILVDYMISQEFYEKKIQYETKKQSTTAISAASMEESNSDQTEKGKTNYKQEVYLKALNQQKKIQVPKKFESIAEQICNLSSNSMLDEFLFWCIKFEFPEAIVKYLLSLLPDIRYKQVFIKSFVSQYSYISILLLNSKSEHLASRVVHISVQLFSNEAIAMKALEESHLLPIILSTLYNMIVTPYNHRDEDKLLIACKSENELNNKHKVIDPDHPIMQENLYWLIISDLVNLLSHKAVAMVLLQNENLIEIWFELISYFQVMNLNVRKFGEHVQQEQPTYFSSFSAELEFCSSVLWSFLQHLKSNQNANLSKQLINLLMINLRKWLTSIDLVSSYSLIKRPNSKHLTFHLPLHRYFSAFIYNAIYEQSCDLDYLLGANECSSHFLADILAYPLQLQIGFHEIHANMWVRNGMQMKGQAMTYVQNHFCTSFSDSDLFLIQVLASRIEPSVFMEIFFQRFHLFKWIEAITKNRHKNHQNTSSSSSQQSVPNSSNQSSERIVASVVEEMLDEFENSTTPQTTAAATNLLNEQEEQDYLSDQAHQVAMLVGSLTVLAQIITIKPNLSFKSYSLTRTEVVNLLCVLDRTYSQIDDSMPDICSLSQAKRFIPNILNDVADFLQPSLDISSIGNLKQGRYKPKDSIWLTEYDPLYTMLRSVKRREFQESFDRYSQFIEKKFTNKKVPKNLWPPFRLPQLAENIEELNNQLHNQIMEQEAEEQETNATSFLNYTNKERLSQLRLDYELRFKSKILNTKSLHAILITILHEHFYTNSIAEKVVYFAVYILELALHFSNSNAHSTETESTSKFDEFNYETWFKSNEIKRNLCTFVPFVSSKFVPIEQQTASISVEEGQSFKAPPQKRICSRSALHSNDQCEQGEDDHDLNETDESKPDYSLNASTSTSNEKFKLQKTKTYESILSLLVKIYHRNKSTSAADDDDDDSKSNQFVKLDFLSSKSQIHSKATGQAHNPFQFETNRIGNENDFIYNLLEKAANSCDKCRLNVEKSLEALNKSSASDKSAQINSTTSIQQSTSSSNNEQQQQQHQQLQQTTVDSEILKNKKLKAKQRQQRILAQMSNSQQAFLLNPINRLDVEAFKETKSTSESALATEETSATTTAAATTSSSIETIKKLDDEYEEEFECCICRLPATSANGQTTDRPLGAVTLLQSTSILGHRESISDKHNYVKHSLPLSDDINYKQLQTDTMCWKKEETRVKILREAFSIDSCKYSINIGWKGGVYAQMCGHYLHFDCYNSYKKTLDEHLTRTSNHEYSCPLCRQIANCVLPIITLSSAFNTNKQQPIQPSHSQVLPSLTPPFSLAHSSLTNTPAKLWILSSLADKQNQLEQIFSNDHDHIDSSSSINSNSKLSPNDSDSLNKHILNLLKTRPFSTPEFSSKTLTQCKNDALAIITLTTPLEFRYIDQFTSTGLAVGSSNTSPIDDDIAMFTSSVLRTQLEIDLMLKQITDDPFTATNLKKRRSCFLPLYDVISTHCRLMCHELKPHVKLWLMLTNPVLLAEEISSQFIKIKIRQFEQSDSNKSLSSNSNAAASVPTTSAEPHKPAVPILLKDPIACLLLVLVNLPTNVNRAIFNSVVQSLFNMVFVQNLIYLCREFDKHERENWSTTTTTTTTTTATLVGNGNGTRWLNFKDYVANLINSLKKTNIFLVNQKANSSGVTSAIDHFVHTTIWSLESAKNYVKTKCLHFLKIASLLQFYFYDQEIQFNQFNSFDYLIKNLNLVYNDDNGSGGLLHWSLGNPSEIINVWIDELITSNDQHHQQIESLYSINFDEYHFPSLLELPYLYSDLFGYYSAKKCQFCSKIPKETGICLLCGVQFCYKNHYCCDSMKDFNKKHLNFCGAQTLVLLNINSTYVFVIRGKRCAPWASLYLDEHGEEDRDLRRGKPLYLNKQRYNLLKSTWLNHSFDYQSLKWYNASLFIY